MPVGHMGWSPDYGGHMGWSPDYGGKIGGIRPRSPQPLSPRKPEDDTPWKQYYAILFGGASVALVALRNGDSASALAALEKAFEALPRQQGTSPAHGALDPGLEKF